MALGLVELSLVLSRPTVVRRLAAGCLHRRTAREPKSPLARQGIGARPRRSESKRGFLALSPGRPGDYRPDREKRALQGLVWPRGGVSASRSKGRKEDAEGAESRRGGRGEGKGEQPGRWKRFLKVDPLLRVQFLRALR